MRLGPAAVALLGLPAAAAAQEAPSPIPPEHGAEADRAQEMVDRIEGGDKTASALEAARALREECLASGNYRSAKFLAGRIADQFPLQLSDDHRYAEILLAMGLPDQAESDLRELVRKSPSDCRAHGLLSSLLVEQGRFADAMAANEAHLREHRDEWGPLYARATIALWHLRDAELARSEAARMRAAADRPGVRKGLADWMREQAASIEREAATFGRDRVVLRAASSRLDRALWGTLVGAVLALGAAGWFTRRRVG